MLADCIVRHTKGLVLQLQPNTRYIHNAWAVARQMSSDVVVLEIRHALLLLGFSISARLR
jgi:hypothetical protein